MSKNKMENKMKIWLLNPYGPLPDEGWRKYRNILLGEELASTGNEVTWFASRFSHHFKRFRKGSGYKTNVRCFNVDYIETRSYSNNIGIGRLIFEMSYCINAYFKLRKLNAPDVIIAADPSQFVGALGRILANKYNSKLILDLMDEWPELFEKATSYKLRYIAKAIVPFFKLLRKMNYKRADGVIALGKNYLNLAKSLARKNTPNELIYNGMDVEQFKTWSHDTDISLLINTEKDDDSIWCVYAGSLGVSGNNYDLPAIIEAAKYFNKLDTRYKFLVAGAGAGKKYILEEVTKNSLENIFFLGSLESKQLAAIYFKCDIGLAVYGPGSNVDMPDKLYDYTAAGLAIISSLTGEAEEVIFSENIGMYYEANNHKEFILRLKHLGNDANKLRVIKENSRKLGKVFDSNIQTKKIHSLINKLYDKK